MIRTNNAKFRTGYIRVALRRDSMQIELLEQEVIVLDSLNLAGHGKEQHGGWNWQQVVKAAKHYRSEGHPVVCVCPMWAPTEIRKALKDTCAQVTLFGREKDLDDKYILMQTMCYDGYFVSNDNNMHKHFVKSNLFIRNWIDRSRIGFDFEEGVFTPYRQRPDQPKQPTLHSLFGEEVRE